MDDRDIPFAEPDGPYASPPAVFEDRREEWRVGPVPPAFTSMRHWQAYRFAFSSPNWLSNLLMGGLCQFIPVVGPIVWLGYTYEVIVALHQRPQEPYPDFDFGEFSRYLVRGIWPFLAQLIVGFVLAPVILFFMYGPLVIALIATGGGKGAEEVVLIALGGGWLFGIALSFLFAALISTPIQLRAGMTEDLGQALSWSFIRDFAGRVGRESVVAMVFLTVSAVCVMLGGYLLCLVGALPAMALVMLASQHLEYQLLHLYIHRGGAPLPVKVSRGYGH